MPCKRFLAKAICWETLSHLVGGLIILAFTGELVTATAITLVSVPVKIGLYAAHEQIWSLTKWGR